MNVFLIGTAAPWLVTVFLIVLLVIFFIYLPKMIIFFWRMPLWLKISLLLTVFAGAYIRFAFVPNIHRIYYDEDRYLAYAVSFARFGKAVNVEAATTQNHIKGDPDPVARVTVPVINGWTLRLLGYSETNLFTVAKLMSILFIILIFIASFLLFKDYGISLITSVGIAFLPNIVYWSTSTNLDVYFVIFSLITLIAGLLYAKKPHLLNRIFLIVSAMTFLFIRLEAFLFLLPVVIAILSLRKINKKPLLTKEDFYLALLAIPLLMFRAIISVSVFGQIWCCGESTPLETFQLPFLMRHLLPNLLDLFTRIEFPFVISTVAIATLFGKKDRRMFILGIWFILYFLLYSSYYAGRFFDYQFSGSYGRFFLMLTPPLLMLAGVGLKNIFQFYQKTHGKGKLIIIIIALLSVLSLYPTVRNYPKLITSSPWAALTDLQPIAFHEYLEKIVAKTPANSIIISSLSGLTLLHGRSSLYFVSLFDNKQLANFLIDSLKKGVPVYSTPNYICDFEPKKCVYFAPYIKYIDLHTPESTLSAELQFTKVVLKTSSESAKYLDP